MSHQKRRYRGTRQSNSSNVKNSAPSNFNLAASTLNVVEETETAKTEFPKKFPFWGRIKFSKKRTTLVIDEEIHPKEDGKVEELFVHREATHTKKDDFEEINPNPDRDDPEPMYLRRPRKHPKKMFEVHNKELDMPVHLQERYDKNNKKE